MEVFIKNVPYRCSEKELYDCLRPHLSPDGRLAYNVSKFGTTGNAVLTLADVSAAEAFLRAHGTRCGPRGSVPKSKGYLSRPITLASSILHFFPGKQSPSPLLLRSLMKESEDRKKLAANPKSKTQRRDKGGHTFQITLLQTGLWEYHGGRLTFVPMYTDHRQGTVILGKKNMVIVLNSRDRSDEDIHVRVAWSIVNHTFHGTHKDPALYFSLAQAPVFHRLRARTDDMEDLISRLAGTYLNPTDPDRRNVQRQRICFLSQRQSYSVSASLVYRVVLVDPEQLDGFQTTVGKTPGAVNSTFWLSSSPGPLRDWFQEFQSLTNCLTEPDMYGKLPFSVKFQLQRLAQNGYLSPRIVLQLLKPIQSLLKQQNLRPERVVEGIRAWARRAPWPDQHQAPYYDVHNICKAIEESARRFKMQGSIYHLALKHSHMGIIHKVVLTPTGQRLEGPDLESKNRILRKYPENPEFFIRTSFTDEDAQQLRTEAGAGTDPVYARYSYIMNNGIMIAGRRFVFLGFSHSSLRAQQCWFMASFWQSELIHAQRVIQGLGDFSVFRSPAKCAARIGQAFSDATETIDIRDARSVLEIRDVERNGRCFTDGVGTISEDLLRRVWTRFAATKKSHATVLQIRYQGAKGVLSLNTMLKGECFQLRPSMIKFKGSQDMKLEITGAGFRRLPMTLNRQFIKIFEDLNVPPKVFMDLQYKAVRGLREVMDSPYKASDFLRKNSIGTEARMPILIEDLNTLGLRFQDDAFLRDFVEVAALVQLRDIKYRGRIPLESAYTLFGIADWTGYLAEGQVYVALRSDDNSREILEGGILVSRSPALHPGDIQTAVAVDVPVTSPLVNVHNCVVFSTKGERDLPSQLGGGDLDGDLYNIIFEPSLWIDRTIVAADYDRIQPIDIGRPVESGDMTEFFLEFMKSDHLGHICTVHLQMADQMSSGTHSPECIKLAQMASTAVDFSKTGIPVDISAMPRFPKGAHKLRPDFMAPSPRFVIEDAKLAFEDLDDEYGDDFDATNLLEPDRKQIRYYRSEKILGHLYRAIDETRFLHDMQMKYPQKNGQGDTSLMDTLWSYVQRQTSGFVWSHQRDLATSIKEQYDDNVADTMWEFSTHPRHPLSELEVFTGNILGREGGNITRRTRESATDMKDKMRRHVTYTANWILHGSGEDAEFFAAEDESFEDVAPTPAHAGESLSRAIACFAVAVEQEQQAEADERRARAWTPRVRVRSFKYIAAALCLREMQGVLNVKLKPLGSGGGPR